MLSTIHIFNTTREKYAPLHIIKVLYTMEEGLRACSQLLFLLQGRLMGPCEKKRWMNILFYKRIKYDVEINMIYHYLMSILVIIT